jgi:hypothetical protein
MLQKTTSFPAKTLYRWVKWLEETNDLKQRSCSGHPKHLTLLNVITLVMFKNC